MASSTCDRPTLPDEQAEPDETAMPSRSSAISSVSAATPGTAKAERVGQPRRAGAEDHRVRRDAEQRRLQRIAQATKPGRERQVRRRACGPEAAIAGDILGARAHAPLLPAAPHQRRPIRCVPPSRAPGRLRPAGRRACGRTAAGRRRRGRRKSSRCGPRACTASQTTQPAVRHGRGRAASRDRLHDAGLVVGGLHAPAATRSPGTRARVAQRGEVERAVGQDRQDRRRLGREAMAVAARRHVPSPTRAAGRAGASIAPSDRGRQRQMWRPRCAPEVNTTPPGSAPTEPRDLARAASTRPARARGPRREPTTDCRRPPGPRQRGARGRAAAVPSRCDPDRCAGQSSGGHG